MPDISLEKILRDHENVYSAVVVLSKRARQITDEQKQAAEMDKIALPVLDNKDSEDFDEVEIDREALLREHKKIPKPTRVAVEEMLQNTIHFEFVQPEKNNPV